MKTFARAPLLFILIAGLTVGVGKAAPDAPHPFEKEILSFEASDRATPPPANAILFVGDSQFARWKTIHQDLPEYQLIARGFGGSKMTDLLYYMDRIVIPYRPRMIVVNEGGNDIHAGRKPEQLLADMKTFVDHVQTALPGVPIIFGGMTPSPARWSECDMKVKFNAMLKAYLTSGKNLIYLDLYNAYLGPDGKPQEPLFAPDKLHHSPAGYAVRMRIMRPFLGPPDFPDRKPAR
jgi:lysophospholipase L1-like esterase